MAVKCPKCQSDNADSARFCSNCATQLISLEPDRPSFTKTIESPVRFVTSGTVFSGRYEILGQIGAGGMGEVYRAIDKGLGRHVAIKVLPVSFAEDKERMARFEREAQLLAALNHPNIAAIHGLEGSEGNRFLVLELAEGETLQARLEREPLSIEEALETCRQLAEGLEAAHEKGIVHRDLKPGNIILTPDGKVKILDFGLAKAYVTQTTDIDIAKSPTITAQMTEPGVILGTVAYMSPEQARGRAVDKRADIWAFGCVLYECLAGIRAFHGETVSDTFAQILKGEPDWSKLPSDTPIYIRKLLRRCLEKNPVKRLHDIADARLEMEAPGAFTSEEALVSRRLPLLWILCSAAVILIAGIIIDRLVIGHPKSVPSSLVVMSDIKIEPGHWLDGMRRVYELERPSRTAMAISNDGRFIVYSAIPENPAPGAEPKIYLRRVDQLSAAPIEGTEGGICPFLSPDDEWIGFWQGTKLMKVLASGGVPITLCDANMLFGADWGPDNSIIGDWSVQNTSNEVTPLFNCSSGLSRISGNGGGLEVLTVPDTTKGEYAHRLPHFLPKGQGVLFTVMRDAWDIQPRLAILDLRTRKWHEIMENAADGRYLRSGHLVFLRDGTLMAVAFDLEQLTAKGQPVPVVMDVMQSLNILTSTYNSAAGQYSVSDSGHLTYVPGGIFPDQENTLVRVDQDGSVQPVADFKAAFFAPRFSPDGGRIVYRTYGREWRLWVYDINRRTRTPLTGEGRANCGIWTPDGKRLVFGWKKAGQFNLFSQPADGSSPMELLTSSANNQRPASFTPDGGILAIIEESPETSNDILLLDMKSRRITPFLNSNATDAWPEFSPDGRWMAYATDEWGSYEVWVRPFPGPGGRWQISKEGGQQPIWSKDMRQLFYRRTGQVWVVDIRTDGNFSVGVPRMLFENLGLSGGYPIRNWDLWPDGRGFLMVKSDERKPTPVTEMILIQNWLEELKRLVPTGKK